MRGPVTLEAAADKQLTSKNSSDAGQEVGVGVRFQNVAKPSGLKCSFDEIGATTFG